MNRIASCVHAFVAGLAALVAVVLGTGCGVGTSNLFPDGGFDAASVLPDASTLDAGCASDDVAACFGKCGQLKDACGKVLDCGQCVKPGYACGAGGTPNVCGAGTCVPNCAGKACGASDDCGSVCSSGSCPAGDRCASGARICDAVSRNGCCDGTTCVAGTSAAECGSGGAGMCCVSLW